MRKSFTLKIITVLIVQAILLTQADFALAASFSAAEHYREFAARAQKIKDHSVNYASARCGVSLVFSFLSGELSSVFRNASGGQFSWTASQTADEEICSVGKPIYKVFAAAEQTSMVPVPLVSNIRPFTVESELASMSKTVDATGPPAQRNNFWQNYLCRTV